jgi:N,N-dimethylformamidase
MYEIDPSRLDLAREFRRKPLGHHSPELQAVLDRMRNAPIEDKHCLIITKPREQWLLAQMKGDPLIPVPVPGIVFTDLAEAEWTVFKLRWQMITGHDLAAEFGEPLYPAPKPGDSDVAAPDPRRAIFGYVHDISIAPGETVDFKVSCLGVDDYRADIVRLRRPQAGPRGAYYLEEEIATPLSGKTYRGRVQRLHLGSYAKLPPLPQPLESFTVQALVWPTRLAAGEQAIIGNWSPVKRQGFALHLDARGAPSLTIGDGSRQSSYSTAAPLTERRWYLVAATFDATTRDITLSQIPVGDHGLGLAQPVTKQHRAGFLPAASSAALMLAGWNDGSADKAAPGAHFNGKLEAPRIAKRVLSRDEIMRLKTADDITAFKDALIGAWDFSLDMSSERVSDLSSHGLHGNIVNLPLRAVTGHNWDAKEMNWTKAPQQYGAMHFHDTDIDDARWENDFSWTVPAGTKSDVYAVRMRGGGIETYVPFFVRPPRDRATAKVAYLAPTATYAAYANNRRRLVSQGTEMLRGHLMEFDVVDMQLLYHDVGVSTYCGHSDGSGPAYGTRLRPMMNFRPKGRTWNFASDLFITDWLEHVGCGYDVITDDDMHKEGVGLMKRYQAVITGTHPEYYTTEMLDALEGFLKGGGRLMYMGGNGFYWRIAFHPQKTGIVEVRRAEDGTRSWAAPPGEYYMNFTGEYGGLWNRQGRPPNAIAGVGFVSQGFDESSYYRRKPGSYDRRAAFIFEGVTDEILGDFGFLEGGAAGEEIDGFDINAGTPPHALLLATSENHTNSYQPAGDVVLVPLGAANGMMNPAIRADMVFFECPNGGAAFSTGSIAYAGSLAHNGFDNNIARLTTNVLKRFLDPTPFPAPEVS